MPTRDPYPAELVDDDAFAKLVSMVCLHPAMFVTPADFDTVCAFIDGYDRGVSGGLLAGFHEWLVVRSDDGNNLNWSGLARQLIGRDAHGGRSVKALGELFEEFFLYRRAVGLTKLYHDYGNWLLRQDWYEGPLRTAN